jgi:choline dehydrogenase
MSAPADYDYIIVGSGAGGGTLAARLVERGMRVLLLEAGSDPRTDGQARLPDDYDVPAFHPFASENPAIRWDFFVRHYANEQQQARDPKADSRGVLYPRASGLGGCTAHNAMIFVAPHDDDWNGLADLTGDASWRADHMQRYLRLLEDCQHRPFWRLLAQHGIDPTGHGWHGWLHTEKGMPPKAIADARLSFTVLNSAFTAVREGPRRLEALWRLFRSKADPNDLRARSGDCGGVWYTPLSTDEHRRIGPRERVLAVARRYPDRLRIELDALATRVIFDESHRAIGVSYRSGARLYRACPGASNHLGDLREAHARREVILCGGVFNTPQLLMLSGIGPRAALAEHAITVRVDLPGVGQNLQDRYEVAIVNRLARSWQVLRGARFEDGDPLYKEWSRERDGMYISNGAALAVSMRSDPRRLPDLFCMALLARFAGYYPGYSEEIRKHHDYLSWTVLKAHTANRAGTVTLRSADPLDPPLVNFRYFEEGTDKAGDDMRAMVTAIRAVRGMTGPLHRNRWIAQEELPGPDVQSDEDLAQFVRDNAWGHHASCSCAIGPRAANGVLESNFRVHGTQGLRVVDASVFPRIPGFFIASAVFMIAEKAADVILADAIVPIA